MPSKPQAATRKSSVSRQTRSSKAAPSKSFEENAAEFIQTFRTIQREIGRVIVGQSRLIEDTLTGLLSGGHVLLEGVPGIGKTLLVHSLASAIHCKFSRVQFTPDLMPSDIIGTRVVSEDETGRKHFFFHRGPVFTQVLLADEINRATPKTQSALLEAMQEKHVTVAGESHVLEPPFFVIATQNPLEMEGTYPLPEAQLDRFMFKLNVYAPTLDELIEVARRTTTRETPQASVVTTDKHIVEMMGIVRDVPIAAHVERFAAGLLVATHPTGHGATDLVKRYVKYGASPRGLQACILGAKVRALLDGRFNVAEDDIREVALPALRHRILLNFEGEAEEIKTDDIVESILASMNAAAA
ncbi:MAG: MoxR family ATPase [Candidatus Hydrogenedentes bacterium]|nr:MoxR family ATPase [Candidatus Hydrogenedentota bacterium]